MIEASVGLGFVYFFSSRRRHTRYLRDCSSDVCSSDLPLLQAAAAIAARGASVAYISGEEAADQVRLRARRLGLGAAPVQLAAATSVRDILTTLGSAPAPALLVIDSIQTMHSDLIEGAPGTVRSQEHTSELQSRQYLVCRLLLEKK